MVVELMGQEPSEFADNLLQSSSGVTPDDIKNIDTWSYWQAIANLIDHYATVCDKVISFFAHTFISFIDFVHSSRSPFEIFSSFVSSLPSLMFSFICSIIYYVFYILTLPLRIFFSLILNHPFFIILIFMLILFFFVLIIACVKRISLVIVFRTGWRAISPYFWPIVHSVVLIVFPQFAIILNTVRIAFSPFTALLDLLTMLYYRLSPLRSLAKSRTPQAESHPVHGRLSATDRELRERMLCCVCFSREKSVLLQPCNHMCLCAECTLELVNSNAPQCPLCRAHIISHVDVFF